MIVSLLYVRCLFITLFLLQFHYSKINIYIIFEYIIYK